MNSPRRDSPWAVGMGPGVTVPMTGRLMQGRSSRTPHPTSWGLWSTGGMRTQLGCDPVRSHAPYSAVMRPACAFQFKNHDAELV